MYSDPDKTVSTTAKVARLYRLGSRRLSRAHLAVMQRPSIAHASHQALSASASALASQLGTPVECSARLLETVFMLERAVSNEAALVLVDLDGAGTQALLEIERPVLNAALERLSGGAQRSSPVSRLTRIEEAAFGFLTLLAVQAVRGVELVERLYAPRIRAVNVPLIHLPELLDMRAPHVGIQIVLKVGRVEGQARLFLPTRALQASVQAEPAAKQTELAPEVLAAGLSLRCYAGRTQLEASDLQALRSGDVVLFDRLSLDAGQVRGPARLSSPGFELFGSFDAAGFQLTRVLARTFPQESSMSQSAPKDDAPVLPVDVEVELTRLRMTVAELASIRSGSILPLHINASEPVILRVGDRAVARAELVEIDGEVGARILTLFS